MTGELAQLTQAERMLAAVATAQEAREVIDYAAAAADLARRAKLGVAIVNHATTVRVRAELRLAALVDQGQAEGSIAAKGTNQHVRDADTLPALGIDRKRLAEARRLRDGYSEEDILRLATESTSRGEELTRASLLKSNSELIHSSESVEWYTPPEIIEAARAVLGGIDLDPASSEMANRTVRAARYYTRDDDGLSQPWKGRIWLNPPFSGQAGPFIVKLAESYASGEVSAAVALVSAFSIGSAWWRPLLGRLLCFKHDRIHFISPAAAKSDRPTFTNVLAYFGPDDAAFAAEFGRFGALMAPWRDGAS